MAEKLKLTDIRREIYASYTEDGLIDLAIGIVIFGFGMFLMADMPWLVGMLGVIPLLLWYLGKRYLTSPRVGVFHPPATMKKQFISFSFSMMALGLGAFVFFLVDAGSGKALIADHPLGLFGLFLGVAISELGLAMKTNRLHLYGFLVFAAMAVGEILDKTIENIDVYLLSVISAGGIILVAGCIVLIGFLQKYPIVSIED